MRKSKYNTGCNEKFKGYAAFLRRLALHDPTRVVTWSLAAYRSATEETKIINKFDFTKGPCLTLYRDFILFLLYTY